MDRHKIDNVEAAIIDLLLGTHTIPVIARYGIDAQGSALHLSSKWAAAPISRAFKIEKMLYLTHQAGPMDKSGKLIPEVDAAEFESFFERDVIKYGMLSKCQTVLHDLRKRVAEVHILNCKRQHALTEELFTELGVGTICRLRSRAKDEGVLWKHSIFSQEQSFRVRIFFAS